MKKSKHLIFWGAYLLIFAINSAFFPAASDSHLSMGIRILRGLLHQSVSVLPVLLMAYTFVYWIFPKFIQTKKYREATISSLLLLLVAVIISRSLLGYVSFPLLYGEQPEFNLFSPRRLFYGSIQLISNTLIFVAFYFIIRQLQQAKEKEELRNAQLELELRFLQSQVNPHFLFNTLNNLYAMARKQSQHTASSIARLSQIFRFMLYKTGEKEISLAEELEIIRHYIELEKLRYDDTLQVEYEEDIETHQQPIGPLLLLPLVENAFKHGAGESIERPFIKIKVQLAAQQLLFVVCNSVDEVADTSPPGIGLRNLRRQLQLQYPDQHQLEIQDQQQQYQVALKIQFT